MKKFIGFFVFLMLLLPLLSTGTAAAANSSEDIARINEDIVVPAGHTVNGDLVAVGGDIEVLGTVNGDVVAVFGNIIMGSTGKIRGESVAVLGSMTGSVRPILGRGMALAERFPRLNLSRWNWRIPYPSWLGYHYSSKAAGLLFQILVTAALIALAPKAVGRVQVNIRKNPLAAGGIGLLTVFAGGALVFFFAITIIGIPVAAILGALLGITSVVAKYLGGAAIGLWVGHAIFKGAQSPLVSALVGSLLVGLLLLVPFTGLLQAIVGLVALGGVMATGFGLKGEEFVNA